MEIKKNFQSMKSRIAGQVASRLQKVDLDSILGVIGLQVLKRSKGMSLPLLAAFASGVAVGALVTPMTGKELRAKVGQLMGRLQKHDAKGDAEHELTAEGEPVESPYDKAKSQRESGGSNGQKKSPRPIEPSNAPPTAT